jgi:hypothetical protein
VTGWVAATDGDFCRYALRLATDAEARQRMGAAARRRMNARSWDSVFDAVYEGYRQVLAPGVDSACEIPQNRYA